MRALWTRARTVRPTQPSAVLNGVVADRVPVAALCGFAGQLRAAATSRPLLASASPEAAKVSVLDGIKAGTFPRFLSKEAVTCSSDLAKKPLTRWLAPVASILIQIPAGSMYSWAMWNPLVMTTLGVIAPAASDWALADAMRTFTVMAISFGAATVGLGPWVERAGPRYATMLGASLLATGNLVSALAVQTHCLPLLYLGWGALNGAGVGIGYISFVSTLIKWFPDRRGLATALALTAFGGGGVVSAGLISSLTSHFFQAPTYLGTRDSVQLIVQNGVQYVKGTDGVLTETIVATVNDVAKFPGLAEGVYAVGTGDVGAVGAFTCLAGLYFTSMSVGAALTRAPPPDFLPEGYTPQVSSITADKGYVTYSQAMKTPQFYLLFGFMTLNLTAGATLMPAAKTLMTEVFSDLYPTLATGSFLTAYAGFLATANATGRFGWSAASDYLTRKTTYVVFGLGSPMLIAFPKLLQLAAESGDPMYFYTYVGSTLFLLTCYGGTLSVLPAYIADLWGQGNVGAIHGRQLASFSVAATIGPSLLSSLRNKSHTKAIEELTAIIDPAKFQEALGAPKSELAVLIEKKTATIPRLLEIAPPGTLDPSPFLYDSTFYTLGGLLGSAAICNALIRKVDSSHFTFHEPSSPQLDTKADEEEVDSDKADNHASKL